MSLFPFNPVEDNLYSAEAVRTLDQAAMAQMKGPDILLMKRAGAAALAELMEAFGCPSLITVFCGSGNNAGDGYIVAALAAQKNISVRVVELGTTSNFSPQTQQARQFAQQANVQLIAFDNDIQLSEGVVVDSLLGIGFSGSLRKTYAQAVSLINAAKLPVLSVDIPSGLHADTGSINSDAVRADVTVTFIGAKKGLFTGLGPVLCGDIIYHSLDVPESVFDVTRPAAQLLDTFTLMDELPEWRADIHKHQRGHCMVIGGDYGYGGAAAIAGEASLRAGSGLTSVVTQPQHVTAVLGRCPEIMTSGVTSGQQLEPLLERPNVLVIGPGLGRSAWSEQLLQKAALCGLPMVVDADALNILAQGKVISDLSVHQWVLTPHPGEAARLLDTDVTNIQADRYAAVRALQRKYNAVVLLKGPGTLIAGDDAIIKVCPYGNPAMATAGMGDLLSGIIGALIAQGLSLQTATELGCCIHSSAADMAVNERGPRGLVATDILFYLHRLMNRELS